MEEFVAEFYVRRVEWQGLRLNNHVLSFCRSVQLANHFSTTHDDVHLPGLFSSDEVRQINNAKSIMVLFGSNLVLKIQFLSLALKIQFLSLASLNWFMKKKLDFKKLG